MIRVSGFSVDRGWGIGFEMIRGQLAAEECGGAGTNTGAATVIANTKFQPKRAISSAQSVATLPVEVGDHILHIDWWRKRNPQEILTVLRVVSITREGEDTVIELQELDGDDWDRADQSAAATAASEKAQCYHCRCLHYVQEERPRPTAGSSRGSRW